MPLNIDWQQILLHMFNFVLLTAALYFLLYKPVKDFMDKRRKEYEEIDAKAKETLASAERKKADYDSKLKEVSAEISERRATSVKEAEAIREDMIAKAQTEADKIIDDARKKAVTERDAMMKEARNEIVNIVSEAAGKIALGEDTSDYDTFIKSVTTDKED